VVFSEEDGESSRPDRQISSRSENFSPAKAEGLEGIRSVTLTEMAIQPEEVIANWR